MVIVKTDEVERRTVTMGLEGIVSGWYRSFKRFYWVLRSNGYLLVALRVL